MNRLEASYLTIHHPSDIKSPPGKFGGLFSHCRDFSNSSNFSSIQSPSNLNQLFRLLVLDLHCLTWVFDEEFYGHCKVIVCCHYKVIVRIFAAERHKMPLRREWLAQRVGGFPICHHPSDTKSPPGKLGGFFSHCRDSRTKGYPSIFYCQKQFGTTFRTIHPLTIHAIRIKFGVS